MQAPQVRQIFIPLPFYLVGHTDLDGLQLVQNIQFGKSNFRTSVESNGLTRHDCIEPSGAPPSPCVGAEFFADLDKVITYLIFEFGNKWARTNSS